MHSTNIKASAKSGFTLVELLVVAPIAILVIAGIVAIMINLVGDVLITQQRNVAAYETQDGLDQIEQDVRLSSSILYSSAVLIPTITSPQGSDQSTAAFVADGGTLDTNTALILSAFATTANPLAATSGSPRSLVYTNQPSGTCPTSYESNDPLNYLIVYFVRNDPTSGAPSLWRRTIVPSATLCGGAVAWQKNSCLPGTSGAQCATNDRKIVDNIASSSGVVVTYYFETVNPYSATTKSSLGATDDPTSVKVTINTSKQVSGSTITSSMSLYASRINN